MNINNLQNEKKDNESDETQVKSVFFPGYDKTTVHLIASIAPDINIDTDNLSTIEYLFWDSSSSPKLQDEVNALDIIHTDIVIAKSLGTLIFLEAVKQKRISFRKAILFGIPVHLAKKIGCNNNIFNELNGNMLVIHQIDDFVVSIEDVKNIAIPNLKIILGSDHKYSDSEQYALDVKQFMNAND